MSSRKRKIDKIFESSQYFPTRVTCKSFISLVWSQQYPMQAASFEEEALFVKKSLKFGISFEKCDFYNVTESEKSI